MEFPDVEMKFQHEFAVAKTDASCWDPASQKMASELIKVGFSKDSEFTPGYFTSNSPGAKTDQYRMAFFNLLANMAELPKAEQVREECAHVAPKKKAKKKGRRK